ncbi:MAG: LCP family protein [Thermoflexales bacterium]|nr:LCP family protein [Thermoflexales bacterium]
MDKGVARLAEVVLLGLLVASLSLGVDWMRSQPAPSEALTPIEQRRSSAGDLSLPATPQPAPIEGVPLPTSTPALPATPFPPQAPSVSLAVDERELAPGDAPLLQQEQGTINVLLLGSDASVDQQAARTDTIIVASISPNRPSVSLLSFPRDLQVRFPDGREERINTVFRMGHLEGYPGGGPKLLATVLRKNFGIKVDHYVRVDFAGFIKAIDTLGGVEVLVECELHDTFPDPESPTGKTDLDLYPGRATLSGKQALWYARSRWSTTDFDRARRQQKVLRALLRKVRQNNLLQNALNLFLDFRPYVETSLTPTEILPLIDVARRLDDLAIKSRVLTWPIVRSYARPDGASVLLPTEQTIPFIAEALAPPPGNQAQTRPHVEVYNASARPDMELVAAERLAWEGFLVVGVGTLQGERFPQTQIINYEVVPKGSPIRRLQTIFNVRPENVIGQADPSSPAAARIVLGEDYNPCPNTAQAAGEIQLQPKGPQVPTPTTP